MKVTLFDIFKYIFKWKYIIAGITILSILVSYFYVETKQSFASEIVIKYTNATAKDGLTPSGTKLDVYELASPNVVSKALKRLNINIGVEAVRAAISITPIIPAAEMEIKNAKLKEGEAYEFTPTSYTIRYTVSKAVTGYSRYARDILDAIINEYMIYFSEMYLTQSRISGIQSDIQIGRNDYIEIAEIIDTGTKDILSYLSNKSYEEAPTFRSPSTGYSFSDLISKYNTIKNVELPTIFSDIFTAKISINKEILIKKYTARRDNYILSSNSFAEKSGLAKGLMDNYVESNKNVINSYNTKDEEDTSFNVIEDINGYRTDSDINRKKATYDDLIEKYALDSIYSVNDSIESQYCDEMINIFSTPADPSVDVDYLTKKVVSNIEKISKMWSDNYRDLDLTIEDYNRYVANQCITCLTSVGTKYTLSLNLFLVLGALMGLLLGMVIAIAVEIMKLLKKSSENNKEAYCDGVLMDTSDIETEE